MNYPALLLTTVLSSIMFLTGCTSSLSGSSYSQADARTVQNVRMGTIESLRPVQIEGIKTPIGTLTGVTVGSITGGSIGGGRGSAIASILGGVTGSMAGSAMEEGLTRIQGVEIIVREDDGDIRAFVQAADSSQPFQVGDRVRILSSHDATRVTL